MTCGHCANFHRNTLPEIKKNYIDTGKARLVMREFPFDPRAEAGFMLARCADDKYFAMVDVLFQQQRSWATVDNAREALLQIARLAGFSQESFEACLTDQQLLDDVRGAHPRKDLTSTRRRRSSSMAACTRGMRVEDVGHPRQHALVATSRRFLVRPDGARA